MHIGASNFRRRALKSGAVGQTCLSAQAGEAAGAGHLLPESRRSLHDSRGSLHSADDAAKHKKAALAEVTPGFKAFEAMRPGLCFNSRRLDRAV